MSVSDPAALCALAKKSTVLFVGDRSSFSDIYIRMIQSELETLNVTTVETLTEARDHLYEDPHDVSAIIFSDRAAETAISTLIEIAEMSHRLHPVLAYQSVNEVRNMLALIDDRQLLERLSFLPLRTRIDCTMIIMRLLVSGERYVSGDVLDMLIAETVAKGAVQATDASTVIGSLTHREIEVLTLLSKGKANKFIAHRLDLSESTVKLHIHHIISKLGVSNRTEAAIAYLAVDQVDLSGIAP